MPPRGVSGASKHLGNRAPRSGCLGLREVLPGGQPWPGSQQHLRLAISVSLSSCRAPAACPGRRVRAAWSLGQEAAALDEHVALLRQTLPSFPPSGSRAAAPSWRFGGSSTACVAWDSAGRAAGGALGTGPGKGSARLLGSMRLCHGQLAAAIRCSVPGSRHRPNPQHPRGQLSGDGSLRRSLGGMGSVGGSCLVVLMRGRAGRSHEVGPRRQGEDGALRQPRRPSRNGPAHLDLGLQPPEREGLGSCH